MSHKILVVDDEPLIVDVLSRILRRRAFDVATAYDARTAIERLNGDPVDLVISDIRMPNGSGVLILDHITGMSTPKPKLIFVTGFAKHEVAGLLSKGASAVLDKPLSIQDLVKSVDEVLGQDEA